MIKNSTDVKKERCMKRLNNKTLFGHVILLIVRQMKNVIINNTRAISHNDINVMRISQ